jgi:hypothetical protein
MKKLIFLGIAFSYWLLLSACTSQEGHLKKAALKQADTKWTETLQAEAREALPLSEVLQTAYLEFMKKNSEPLIEDVQFQGENRATVAVIVSSISLPLRRTLLKIASQVGPDKTRRFNFQDALAPVAAQSGESTTPEKRPFAVYKFSKGEDGLWRPE